jgi:hypothetical protein
MSSIVINSASSAVRVFADNNLLRSIINNDFLSKYIPEVIVSRTDKRRNIFQLTFQPSHITSLEFVSENKVCFNYQIEIVSIRDLISVIDYVLDFVRQKDGVYNIHASACSLNDKAIVFIGSVSGLGKTTLALNLCLNKGFKFIGDEKVLLSEDMTVIGGVKTIEYNKNQLYKTIDNNYHNKDITNEKTINVETQNIALALIIQPMIVKNGNLFVNKWEPIKSEWHLYEEMTRKIRGISRRVNNFSVPIPSIDTNDIAVRRSQFAKQLSKKIQCFDIGGDLAQVEKKICEIINEI